MRNFSVNLGAAGAAVALPGNIRLTLPGGLAQINGDDLPTEDTILDTVLGVIPEPQFPGGIINPGGPAVAGARSFANIKNELVRRPFLNPANNLLLVQNPILGGNIQIKGNIYQLRCSPVKWKIGGNSIARPLPNVFQNVMDVTNIVLIIDASFFPLSTLRQMPLEGGGPYNIYIISNIENDSDSATKIREFTGNAPNINIYFLKEEDPNYRSTYPLVMPPLQGRDPVLFSSYTLQSRRNESQKKGIIDSEIIQHGGAVFQTVNNIGEVSGKEEAAKHAIQHCIESIPEVGQNPPQGTMDKMMNYFMLKRAGDWCQALSLADTTRRYHVYDHLFEPIMDGANQRIRTLQGLQEEGCETALVTHDRILLAFALYHGVNVVFSLDELVTNPPGGAQGVTGVRWMLYFKNMATQAGEGVILGLINQKIADININLNVIQPGIETLQQLVNLDLNQPRNTAINGGIINLQGVLNQEFQAKVMRILDTYRGIIGGHIFEQVIIPPNPPGYLQRITGADDVANRKFRQYVHYFRLMLFQLSELIHPSTIGVLPEFAVGEAPTINKYSAVENYMKKVKETLEKNRGIIPGQYIGIDNTGIDFQAGLPVASPLPPNDNNEIITINNVTIFGDTPNYNRRTYTYIQFNPALNIHGIPIDRKKSVEALPKTGGNKDRYNKFYSTFYKNNAKEAGELFKFFKIIKEWENIPAQAANPGYNNNDILTGIRNLLPLRLGQPVGDDDSTRTTQHDIHDKFIDLLPEGLRYPGWGAVLVGGAAGDNYIKKELRSEKMYTFPLQPVGFYDNQNNPIQINNVQQINNAIFYWRNVNGQWIDRTGIDVYRNKILKSSDYFDAFGRNINNRFETDFINLLILRAITNELQEPYFTSYVQKGFNDIYTTFFGQQGITVQQYITHLTNNDDENLINIIDVTHYIVQNHEDIMKPRGSSYYDSNNNLITCVDDYVIDSRYEETIKDILRNKFVNFQRIHIFQNGNWLPYVDNEGLNQLPYLNNSNRTTIPFFIYRFLIYYVDTILARIRKLDEFNVRDIITYSREDIVRFNEHNIPIQFPIPPGNNIGQDVPINQPNANEYGNVILNNYIQGQHLPLLNNRGDYLIQENKVIIKISNPPDHPLFIIRTYTEENLVERYKLSQELNALFGLVYTNFIAGDNPRSPRFYWDRFVRIKTYFLDGVDVPLPHPAQPAQWFSYIKDFDHNYAAANPGEEQIPGNFIQDRFFETHLPSKQQLYNHAKIVQFIHIIFYYIFMLDGYKQIDYRIDNMISQNTTFLRKFLEIDEVLFPAPPGGPVVNQGEQASAIQNIVEKGLLDRFIDLCITIVQIPPRPAQRAVYERTPVKQKRPGRNPIIIRPAKPAVPALLRGELYDIILILQFYINRRDDIRFGIIRPIQGSLNTIINQINQINNLQGRPQIPVIAQMGGDNQTRKQRKSHKGVKTRTAKPRKQSQRRS